MKSNKERGFYSVEYECINCGDAITIDIEYGKSIPVLVNKVSVISKWNMQAPECEYCGCMNWSFGKKPKK